MDEDWAQNVVVVTGTTGSGKSTVCTMFAELGAPVMDADKFARDAVAFNSDALREIVQTFGDQYLHADGTLDRKRLGDHVFADPIERERLERIVHPRIRDLVRAQVQKLQGEGHPLIIYDCPLFFEAKLDQLPFRAVIVVAASEDQTLARVMKRDSISAADAQARSSAQLPSRQKEQHADYVLYNNGSLSELRTAVGEVYEQLTS